MSNEIDTVSQQRKAKYQTDSLLDSCRPLKKSINTKAPQTIP
jgi:hypothetical protein